MSPVYARDCSNYTDELTPALLEQWKAEGVGLALLQAFPASYTQYAEQRRQMAACDAANMPFDCYVYDYLSAPSWLDGALAGLKQARDEAGLLPRKVWLDEEDTETEVQTVQGRVSAVSRSVAVANAWCANNGLVWRAGLYTAAWWWVPRMGNTTAFSDLDLWTAQYDSIASADVFTPFGGWQSCRIKQYAGTQPDGTDLNVLSDAEAAQLGGSGDDDDVPVDQGWIDKKPAVVQLAGELLSVADQLLAEANRKNGPRVTVIRQLANPEVRGRAEQILA